MMKGKLQITTVMSSYPNTVKTESDKHWGEILCLNRQDVGLHNGKHTKCTNHN